MVCRNRCSLCVRDRLTNVVNVMGNCFAAALVENLSKQELEHTGEEPTADR